MLFNSDKIAIGGSLILVTFYGSFPRDILFGCSSAYLEWAPNAVLHSAPYGHKAGIRPFSFILVTRSSLHHEVCTTIASDLTLQVESVAKFRNFTLGNVQYDTKTLLSFCLNEG